MTKSRRVIWKGRSIAFWTTLNLRGYGVTEVLEDVASGLNENRKSLSKLFGLVEERRIGVVVVAFKDRLTRFGFRYLERYFSSHGVRVEAVNGEEPKGRLPRTSRGLDSLSI
jgi:predicted site-specific integrase-resolvase